MAHISTAFLGIEKWKLLFYNQLFLQGNEILRFMIKEAQTLPHFVSSKSHIITLKYCQDQKHEDWLYTVSAINLCIYSKSNTYMFTISINLFLTPSHDNFLKTSWMKSYQWWKTLKYFDILVCWSKPIKYF